MPKFLQMKTPDDITATEKKIINFAYANIYALVPDPIDKFIIAFHFDLGHTVETTAVATGLSRKTVWVKKNKIRKALEGLKLDKSIFSE
jgi:hypothetical protein